MRRRHNHVEERDSAIYEDDCVEVLIDLSGSNQPSLFHFAVNSCSLVYDAWNGDTGFQSDIKVASKVEKDFWVVEAKIPFSDLGFAPHGAEIMQINFGRERHFGNENSCTVSGEGSFLALTHFLPFRPMPPDAVSAPLDITGFGSPHEPRAHFQTGTAADGKSLVVKAETLDATRQKIRSFSTVVKSDAAETTLAYEVSGKTPVAAVRLSVSAADDESKVLYSSTYAFPMNASERKLRAMKIDNPLCEELFSDELPPQRDFHGFQWIFGAGQAGYMRMFALQNALPFSVRAVAQEQKDTGMAIYSNARMIKWMKTEVFADEFDTPMAAMPRPIDGQFDSPLPYDLCILPAQRQAFLEDVKTIASDKKIRILTFGDEVSDQIDHMLVEQFAKHPDDKDLLALDAKIKDKYGQGKYGIPKSLEEDNPVALIAYRRAVNDELVELHREAAKLARSINPDIIIVSEDPIGAQSRICSFADQRDTFDIVTHQLYPRCLPDEDDFGFLTRYIGDLTGAEVWPCPHIEEYAATFTPEEVLYLLSGPVRNGATGFHYFLHDTTGNETGKRYLIHERWGAPDRYAVELGAQKFLKAMPRLKFPERDVALFSSTDSLRAVAGMCLRRLVENDVFLHGYLAYGAGVSYRFINELTLDNLDQYKFIVTAESKYLPQEAFAKLQSYVREGGILLIIHPDCFTCTSDGKSLVKEREKFTGVTINGQSNNPQYFTYNGIKVEVGSIPSVNLTPAPMTKVLARFANGDAALVENKQGKGRVVTLASHPCVARLAGNKSWKAFFHSFAKACNAKTDCDIWRFQLPKSLLPETVELPGTCITNNAVRWEHFVPVKINGCELSGSYSYSPNPDYAPDCGKGEISFEIGKLTDRPRAVLAGSCVKEKSNWGDWAVCWTPKQAITIHAKWSASASVKYVTLFVAGTLGDTMLEIGGKTYDFPIPENFNADTLSVREFKMELPQPVKASEVTIKIASAQSHLYMAEMEIWSE